jgi:hypothetical protein
MLFAQTGVSDALVCKDYGSGFHILANKFRNIAQIFGVARSHDDARSPSACIVAAARKDIACRECLHESDEYALVLGTPDVTRGTGID